MEVLGYAEPREADLPQNETEALENFAELRASCLEQLAAGTSFLGRHWYTLHVNVRQLAL